MRIYHVSMRKLGTYCEAPTRSKAKAMFFKKHGLAFTTPVRTQLIRDCAPCDKRRWAKGKWDERDLCPACGGDNARDNIIWQRRKNHEEDTDTI